jgi:cytidylate kinase
MVLSYIQRLFYKEHVMAIITISRELAAMGDETALELAKLLNYTFVDKEEIEENIKSYGFTGAQFSKYDERKPGFWTSLSRGRDNYLHYLKMAMFAEAAHGNCIMIGRGAAAILKHVPGVVSVFLAAPYEIRAERVKSYFQCDDKRAKQIIEQSDKDREGFHRYFFDIDWTDACNYHLCINTGNFHPMLGAKIIKGLLEEYVDKETENQGLKKIHDLALAQKVNHHILMEKNIPIHFLETEVSGSKATLFGVASSQSLVEAAIAAAQEVDLIQEVQSELQVVQEYSTIP